jgi:hypothetical protein
MLAQLDAGSTVLKVVKRTLVTGPAALQQSGKKDIGARPCSTSAKSFTPQDTASHAKVEKLF